MARMTTTAKDPQHIVDAVLANMPASLQDLRDLVAIPSVSAAAFDQSTLDVSVEAVAELFRQAGMPTVEILKADRPDGTPGAPAVVAHRPAPAGAPTVLLYAHHDVQPPGDEGPWESPAFTPTERNGRLYGRGTADDKAGVIAHLAAVRTLLASWSDGEGVGLTVFIEGEEEIGSPSFLNFVNTYKDKLQSDVIIVADADNWTPETPALTTSLRGMVDIDVTVSTLGWAQHSGMNGGAVPDAPMALTITLAKLWDDAGDVAVDGLLRAEASELDYTEERLRRDTGLLDGVDTIGTGSLLSRRWTRPSVTIIGTDAPSIDASSNTLYPTATARLSLRVPPGQDAVEAYECVKKHLEASVPFNAKIDVVMGEAGKSWQGTTDDAVYGHALWALEQAWGGTKPVFQGMGGSIPFIPELQHIFPEATVLVTGVEDPDARAHGANESLHLAMFEKACVAEALLLSRLAGHV